MKKIERKKYIQGSILILWKENISEEKRKKAIQNFYINNENLIESMQTFEMRKGIDIYEEWEEFQKQVN